MGFMDHSVALAAPYLEHYGYFAVMVAVMLEGVGIPLPGLTLLVAASVLAGRGQMSLPLVFISAFLAAVIGYNSGYQIGSLGGRRMLLRTHMINRHHLRRVHRLFTRWGAGLVIIAPFIDGLRQLNGLVAGMLGMPRHRFILANGLGCLTWAGVWSALPFMLSKHLNVLLGLLSLLRPYLMLFAIVLLVLLLVYLFNQHGNPEVDL